MSSAVFLAILLAATGARPDAQPLAGLVPYGLAVDPGGNGIFEPGEAVIVQPTWRNSDPAPQAVTASSAASLARPARRPIPSSTARAATAPSRALGPGLAWTATSST
jgi:hypothetical protein